MSRLMLEQAWMPLLTTVLTPPLLTTVLMPLPMLPAPRLTSPALHCVLADTAVVVAVSI